MGVRLSICFAAAAVLLIFVVLCLFFFVWPTLTVNVDWKGSLDTSRDIVVGRRTGYQSVQILQYSTVYSGIKNMFKT